MKAGIYLTVVGVVLLVVAIMNIVGLFIDRGMGWTGIIIPTLGAAFLLVKGISKVRAARATGTSNDSS